MSDNDVPGCVHETGTDYCKCADTDKWIPNDPEDGGCKCVHTAADWWTLASGSCTCPNTDALYRESSGGNCQCIANTADGNADGACTANTGYTIDTTQRRTECAANYYRTSVSPFTCSLCTGTGKHVVGIPDERGA